MPTARTNGAGRALLEDSHMLFAARRVAARVYGPLRLAAGAAARAEKYFQYVPSGEVFVEDARTFLNRTNRKYDVVVHDTFTGGATPVHLLSKEAVTRVRDMLRPNGMLVLNFVGGTTGNEGEASVLVARTLRSVFREVRAVRDSSKGSIGNIVFFASNAPLHAEAIARAQLHGRMESEARQQFLEREVMQDVTATSGPVVTDSENPLTRVELPIAEDHALAMNKLLPLEVWLH